MSAASELTEAVRRALQYRAPSGDSTIESARAALDALVTVLENTEEERDDAALTLRQILDIEPARAGTYAAELASGALRRLGLKPSYAVASTWADIRREARHAAGYRHILEQICDGEMGFETIADVRGFIVRELDLADSFETTRAQGEVTERDQRVGDKYEQRREAPPGIEEPDDSEPRPRSVTSCSMCGKDLTPTREQLEALRRFGNPLRREPCLETRDGLHRVLPGELLHRDESTAIEEKRSQ